MQAPKLADPQRTIHSVVGHSPTYKATGCDNLTFKISLRIKEFFKVYKPSKMGSKKFAVIVGK
jgi:hypothetical protein